MYKLYPKSFQVFTSCLLSPLRHFKEKEGGVFKTILLFVGRVSLAMEGKSVLPMHKAILGYKRKYTLKYPNGLITYVCRIG